MSKRTVEIIIDENGMREVDAPPPGIVFDDPDNPSIGVKRNADGVAVAIWYRVTFPAVQEDGE